MAELVDARVWVGSLFLIRIKVQSTEALECDDNAGSNPAAFTN